MAATSNEVRHLTDGFGAVAADGAYFWRVRSLSLTLQLDDSFDVFGFSYSDLELGAMDITFHGATDTTISVDETNPNENMFVGYAGDEPFSSVTIRVNNMFDSVGIDG